MSTAEPEAPAEAPVRLTAQRQVVLTALREMGRTVGAVELFEALRPDHAHLGRATVFRTLDLLVEMGMAQRFEGEGHVYLYTSCDPAHHHHLVCRHCGVTTDIGDGEVEALISSIRRRHGFALDHSSLDFYGSCSACAPPGVPPLPAAVRSAPGPAGGGARTPAH